MRDIKKYTENYNVPNFEDYQIIYRRRKVLEIIQQYRPQRILEIGCGMEPIFSYLPNYSAELYTVVEPSSIFYERAVEIAAKVPMNIKCKKCYFEYEKEYVDDNYDMIICASLIHEIEDVDTFCRNIYQISKKNTIIHFNVPNANSMHRQLAYCMGIIEDNAQLTDRNILFQQNRVFTKERLIELLNKCKFEIIETGTFFIKPFTHFQMYEMMKNGIINEAVLDGLYNLSNLEEYKDVGSELWCNVKIKE